MGNILVEGTPNHTHDGTGFIIDAEGIPHVTGRRPVLVSVGDVDAEDHARVPVDQNLLPHGQVEKLLDEALRR